MNKKLVFNSLAIFTSNYPTQLLPNRGIFVERLVRTFISNGLSVDVINPISIPNYTRSFFNKKGSYSIAGSRIIRPFYFSYSNKKILGLNLNQMSKNALFNAFCRDMEDIRDNDAFMGKFLMSGGRVAVEAKRRFSKPAFADLGESKLLKLMNKKETDKASDIIKNLDGIFCVSKRLMNEVIELGAAKEKVFFCPNSVNTKLFKKLDKQECRKKLKLPQNKYIVIFVGHFRHRKGPFRVLKAIEKLDNGVKGVFVGAGSEKPVGDRVLFAGIVPHNDLPYWLNAADLFVLPTLAEGHCNAINEALACGLPIITSDIEDVRGQLEPDLCSYINPLNIDEIVEAIDYLRLNPTKSELYVSRSLSYSEKNFKTERGEKILNIIKQKLSKN